MQRDNETKQPHSFKAILVALSFTFAVTVAVLVGNRLSDQALAVLAGSVCGVGAAIPTSLIILAVSRWRDRPRDTPHPFSPVNPLNYPYQQHPGYPPVIVVAPPQGQLPQWGGSPYPTPFGPPVEREFTVVGGQGEQDDLLRRYPV